MHKKPSDAALAVSLVLLLILTIVVISGGQNIVLQKKMSSAVRDLHISLEMAESGIRDAGAQLDLLTTMTDFDQTTGFYKIGDMPADYFSEATWTAGSITGATKIKYTTGTTDTAAQYMIEDAGIYKEEDADSGSLMLDDYDGANPIPSNVNAFKIVSRSTGRNGRSERILISYYGKEF